MGSLCPNTVLTPNHIPLLDCCVPQTCPWTGINDLQLHADAVAAINSYSNQGAFTIEPYDGVYPFDVRDHMAPFSGGPIRRWDLISVPRSAFSPPPVQEYPYYYEDPPPTEGTCLWSLVNWYPSMILTCASRVNLKLITYSSFASNSVPLRDIFIFYNGVSWQMQIYGSGFQYQITPAAAVTPTLWTGTKPAAQLRQDPPDGIYTKIPQTGESLGNQTIEVLRA